MMPTGKTTSLNETAERFRALVNASPIGQVLIDRQGRIMVSNPAASAIFSWEQNALVAELSDSKFVNAFEALCEKTWQGDDVRGVELTFTLGDNTWILSTSTVAIEDEATGTQRLSAFFEDITTRRLLEKQLAQVQKLDAIGKLAGGIAHDFNNLLTVITGRSHRILNRLKPEDLLWQDADIIHQTGERAAKLMRQLLAFSRKHTGPAQVISLNALIADMDSVLQSLTGEGISCEVQLDSDLNSVFADPAQLEQVILNLVVNACEAMPQGGRLHIATDRYTVTDAFVRTHVQAQVGIYSRLTIRDTGVGMDEATQNRVFEPFFSSRPSSIGLGLATVYGIVTQADGFLTIESMPGAGCTIAVHFPVQALDESDKEATITIKKTNEVVLVVEDEDDVRSLIQEILASQGYDVHVASNWIEAFGIAKKLAGKIDLLLTDVVMPQMSGREIAASLHPLCPNMRILYMSGYTDHAIVHHGVLEADINFIQKPFNPDGLLHAVRKVLEE